MYAFDNLDLDLKHSTPTLEQSADTLVHLTTGLLLLLYPDVLLSNLDCMTDVWKHSPVKADCIVSPPVLLEDLVNIHPELPLQNVPSLNHQEHFYTWKFWHDLAHWGPEYFQRFQSAIGTPEAIDQIPLKPPQPIMPLKTLKVHPNTPRSNAQALDGFFEQTWVRKLSENPDFCDKKTT